MPILNPSSLKLNELAVSARMGAAKEEKTAAQETGLQGKGTREAASESSISLACNYAKIFQRGKLSLLSLATFKFSAGGSLHSFVSFRRAKESRPGEERRNEIGTKTVGLGVSEPALVSIAVSSKVLFQHLGGNWRRMCLRRRPGINFEVGSRPCARAWK